MERDVQWHIAAQPSDIAKLPEGRSKAAAQMRERRKASVRAEHPFRAIKRQFGLMKVLWMARRQLMTMAAVRPRSA